jgi:hypothetical protein
MTGFLFAKTLVPQIRVVGFCQQSKKSLVGNHSHICIVKLSGLSWVQQQMEWVALADYPKSCPS